MVDSKFVLWVPGIRKLEYFFALLIFVMIVCFYINWIKMSTNVSDLLFGWFAPVEVFENSYASVQVCLYKFLFFFSFMETIYKKNWGEGD